MQALEVEDGKATLAMELDGKAGIDHAIHGSGQNRKVKGESGAEAPAQVAQLRIVRFHSGDQGDIVKAVAEGQADGRRFDNGFKHGHLLGDVCVVSSGHGLGSSG